MPAARKVLAEQGGSTAADIDAELVGQEHLRNTVHDLLQSSELIAQAVADGSLGIVGANYRLNEGTAVPIVAATNGVIDVVTAWSKATTAAPRNW